MRCAAIAVALAVVGRTAVAQPVPAAPAPAPAPATPEAVAAEMRCKQAFADLGRAGSAPYCQALGAQVVTAVLNASRDRTKIDVLAAAAQPRITDTPGAQSSAGQTAAVASGHPVATTGGSLAAVGDTGNGLQLVTALAVNPVTLALPDTSQSSIWATRLADVSLILPLQAEGDSDNQQRFRYVGARFRINTLAAIDPPELRDAVAAWDKLGNDNLGPLTAKIMSLIRDAPDPAKCATAIEHENQNAQLQDCRDVLDTASVKLAARTARAALSRFLARADRSYLTLEGRMDRGDLNNDMAKDTLLAAYIAAGRSLTSSSEGGAIELRGRGGFVYFHDGMTSRSTSAGYVSVGFELALVRELKRYSLSVACELTRKRGDNPLPSEAATDAVRLGLAVPLDDGKVVSVGVTIPTNGGASTIALSGDWSLLFGK